MFDEKTILARLQNGEDAQTIANEMAAMINAANKMYAEEIAKAEEAKRAEEQKKALNAVAYEMGTPIQIPFMFLCFICLACIEAYAVTDKGFIDVEKGQIIDPILEVIE